MKKTLIIIPAYNEQDSLVSTVATLDSHSDLYDYLVVNDGSSDATEQICIDNHFNYASLPVNLGLTGAFKTGLNYALRHGYKYAIQFDADGQHDAAYLPLMICTAEEQQADVVIGSRFVNTQKEVSARMAGSRLLTALIKLTTSKIIKDPTSGMRLYSDRIMKQFIQDHDFAPEPDTIAILLREGAKVVEVQVEMHERTAGESYLTFTKSISYMWKTCMSLLFMQWFRR